MRLIVFVALLALVACGETADTNLARAGLEDEVENGVTPAKQPDGSPLTAQFCLSEEGERIHGNTKSCAMVACDQGDEASCEIAQQFATQHAPEDDKATSASGVSSFSPHEQKLIEEASEAWSDYRGGSGDQDEAYDRHSVALAKLFGRGICWGRAD